MSGSITPILLVSGAIVAIAITGSWSGQAQAPAPPAAQSWTNFTPTNDLPNPYNTMEGFFKLGRPSGDGPHSRSAAAVCTGCGADRATDVCLRHVGGGRRGGRLRRQYLRR